MAGQSRRYAFGKASKCRAGSPSEEREKRVQQLRIVHDRNFRRLEISYANDKFAHCHDSVASLITFRLPLELCWPTAEAFERTIERMSRPMQLQTNASCARSEAAFHDSCWRILAEISVMTSTASTFDRLRLICRREPIK